MAAISYKRPYSPAGFTLVEVLIVIGILSIVIAAAIIVMNPAERVRAARDTQRQQDISALDSAIRIALTQDPNLSFGTSSVVYVSLVDTTSTCDNLNLPVLPSGVSYQCPTSADDSRKLDGTGWLPIDLSGVNGVANLSSLPVDPVNTSDTYHYYSYITDGSSYKIQSIVESEKFEETASGDGGTSNAALETGSALTLSLGEFPNGWVRVPGSATYGTSDFWVMKYEAKYDTDGDGIGNDAGSGTPPTGCRYNNSYDTWNWGSTTSPCPSSWSGANLVSSADGSVVSAISHNEVITA